MLFVSIVTDLRAGDEEWDFRNWVFLSPFFFFFLFFFFNFCKNENNNSFDYGPKPLITGYSPIQMGITKRNDARSPSTILFFSLSNLDKENPLPPVPFLVV